MKLRASVLFFAALAGVTGTLPPPPTLSHAPEPGSLILMGPGITALAGAFGRHAKR